MDISQINLIPLLIPYSRIPVFSGMGLRVILFVIALSVGIFFLMRYASKVKQNPVKYSHVYEDDKEKREQYKSTEDVEVKVMNTRQKYASIAALLFIIALVYGVLGLGWFMVEMAGLFIFMGIVVGLIAGLNSGEISDAFTKGFREVLMGAIIIGLARSVAVVLEDGRIMDTIVNSLGSMVGELPSVLGAVGMFVSQLVINFIIPSGSGQALVTMPIMGPLADIIGVTRQTAVLAFQLGDGFAHILYPTSGYFMAALVIAGVSWQKWMKFYWPVFIAFTAISVVFLIFAQLIQWTG